MCERFDASAAAGQQRLRSVMAALDRKISACQSRSRGFLRISSTEKSDAEREMTQVWAPTFRVR